MKYLPEQFPIRYAIIVNQWEEDVNQKIDNFLFGQLMTYLHEFAVSESILDVGYSHMEVKINGTEVVDLSKINDRLFFNKEEIVDYLKKIFPKEKVLSTSSCGSIFHLGLYSYEGAGELPAFALANSCLENVKELVDNFGLDIQTSEVKYLHKQYLDLKEGKLSETELFRLSNMYGKPIHIVSHYSDVWKKLDNGCLDGILPLVPHKLKPHTELIIDCLKNEVYYDKKINVVVCRNWHSLFVEEMYSLLKSWRYCSNCKKPLPFDYEGKYCPTLPENVRCTKERNRLRSKKRSQNSL